MHPIALFAYFAILLWAPPRSSSLTCDVERVRPPCEGLRYHSRRGRWTWCGGEEQLVAYRELLGFGVDNKSFCLRNGCLISFVFVVFLDVMYL